MMTRSKSKTASVSKRADSEAYSTTSSKRAAHRLALEAEHAKRLVEIERNIAAAERAASEKELQAQIAALSCGSQSSRSRRSSIDRWLDASIVDPQSRVQNLINLPCPQVVSTASCDAPLEARTMPDVDPSPMPDSSELMATRNPVCPYAEPASLRSKLPSLQCPPLEARDTELTAPSYFQTLSQAHTSELRDDQLLQNKAHLGPEDHHVSTINNDAVNSPFNMHTQVAYSCSGTCKPTSPRPVVSLSGHPAAGPLEPTLSVTSRQCGASYARAHFVPEAVWSHPPFAATFSQPVPMATASLPAHHCTLGAQYNAGLCNTNNKLSSKTDTLQLAEAVAQVAAAAATKAARCPKVSQLPFFDGRPTDWLVFKRIYDETSSSFSLSENLARLNASLRGAARDAVVVLLAAARDPQEILRALEIGFARPEQIILAELSALRSLPKLTSAESARELNAFALKVSNCLQTVKLLDRPEYLASPELCNEILVKMTPLLRTRWADFAARAHQIGKLLEILSDFLMCEADLRVKYGVYIDPSKSATKMSCHVTAVCQGTGRDNINSRGTLAPRKAPERATPYCLFCKKDHFVRECKSFKALPVDKRRDWAFENKVCRKCLEKGSHMYRRCRKFSCKEEGCKYPSSHHTLLHIAPREEVAHVEEETDTHPEPSLHLDAPAGEVSGHAPPSHLNASVVVAHSCSPSSSRSVLKVVPVTLSGPKGNLDTYALLDDGSTATLLDAAVAEAIGAQGPKTKIRVDGVGGMTTETLVSFVDFQIKGKHASETYFLKNVRSIANLGLKRQSITRNEVARRAYLADICDVVCHENAVSTVLIGVDNWELTVAHNIRRGARGQPVAALTPLGWVLYGSMKGKSSPTQFINHCSTDERCDEVASLDAQLRDYFRVDSIGIAKKPYYSPMDEFAIRSLEKTTRRYPCGRFETGLIWKPNITFVPDSFGIAHSRFLSLERKMSRDHAYAEAYRSNIDSILKKGYAEACDKPPGPGVGWYLPHFGVLHPQKKKLRVVHDAAAKCLGVSLSSLLLPGPDLLQPLLAILMRFREGRVALNADIREMFPQTKIRLEDRDAQRFLWRRDPSEPIWEFRMSSMMFGATSSPFTAIYLKNKNAEEHRSSYPKAADAIINDHYMDDYLGSLDSEHEAARLAADIVHVHAQASLEMRSWASNSKEALASLPPDLLAPSSSPAVVRILGTVWDVNSDTLRFARDSIKDLPNRLTKRSVLAHLMRVYDPLGFLTPIVVKGRVIFQRTWKLGIGWDEEPSSLVSDWRNWFVELSVISFSTIPWHYIRHKPARTAELHIFADASELAYACVAYWRFECDDGSVMLSLIGGKARLAPLKPLSIPRLELQAALIAARFATYILEAHVRKPEKVYFWSDSLTVLKWLRSDARSYKTFVAHRLGEITESTNVKDWRYVPSALNVADDATRITHVLKDTSRWFTGPLFLERPESDWPREPSSRPALPPEELKRTNRATVMCTDSEAPILPSPVVANVSQFSCWLRLLRATARILHCARAFKSGLCNRRSPSRSPTSSPDLSALAPLTLEDLEVAERLLLLRSQLNSFAQEYAHILRGEPLPNRSRLKRLDVRLNRDGILCLSGRIAAALEHHGGISNTPPILDGRETIVRLLITHYHRRAAHGFNEMVVNELKQRYFIIGLRPAVRGVSSRCQTCRMRKGMPQAPPVGDLPPERLTSTSKPFSCVGLDYFGPITVTIARHTEKRYVALFTCLTVRAIHLEVVSDLSADCAIMALRRFIARRGTPITIYSDNGTAFVGADRLLRSQLSDFSAERGIRWKFITPAAPFMGGAWERLVRTVKTALGATLHQRAPKEEVLMTLLAEAEGLVNSRPLTHVAVDPGTPEAITPFHFLLGVSSPYSRAAEVTDDDLIRRVRWKKGLRLADHFWARWVKEYLPTLVPRPSVNPSRPIQEGDLVLVADGNLPRGVWPKGRVVKTIPGKDGIVRSVEVATSTGILKRPVRKLVFLCGSA